jgi:hypothetical protein
MQFERAISTESEYQKKIKTILKVYGEDLLVDGRIASVGDAEEIFYRIKIALRTNTARKYRVVLRWYLKTIGFDVEALDFRITEPVSRGSKQKEYAHEARSFVLKNMDKYSWRNSEAKEFLALHLIYGPLIGYRMSEIKTMKLIKNDLRVDLSIRNGKASNGRANGEFRELQIPSYFEGRDVYEDLNRLVELATDEFIDSARRFHDIIRLDIPKQYLKRGARPTLTSTRHEYVLCSREVNDDLDTSASLGHKSAKTQRKHYGRSRVGRNPAPEAMMNFIKNIFVARSNVAVVKEWFNKNSSKLTKSPELLNVLRIGSA